MSRSKRNESIEKESLTVGVLLSPRENLVDRSLYDYKEIKIIQVNNNNYSLRYIREDSTYVDNANFSYKNINDKFVLKGPVAHEPVTRANVNVHTIIAKSGNTNANSTTVQTTLAENANVQSGKKNKSATKDTCCCKRGDNCEGKKLGLKLFNQAVCKNCSCDCFILCTNDDEICKACEAATINEAATMKVTACCCDKGEKCAGYINGLSGALV